MVAFTVVGLTYTNCGSEKSDSALTSHNQEAIALKDSNETDTDVSTEESQPYGESTLGSSAELVGRTYTLPLTGTVLQIEKVEVEGPKENLKESCQHDIGAILKKVDIEIMIKQAANEVINYEKIGQWVKLDFNDADSVPTCGGECSGDTCCKVKITKKVLAPPTSQFVFSKNILGKPVKLKNGKTIIVKNVAYKNEAGDLVDSGCYLDLNDPEFDFLRTPTYFLDRKKETKSEEGSTTEYTICKGRGHDCIVYL